MNNLYLWTLILEYGFSQYREGCCAQYKEQDIDSWARAKESSKELQEQIKKILFNNLES